MTPDTTGSRPACPEYVTCDCMAPTSVPPGVIACGPDGRQQQLPPEDVAVVEEFADSLKRKEER